MGLLPGEVVVLESLLNGFIDLLHRRLLQGFLSKEAGHLRLRGLHAPIVEVPEGGVHVVAVADEGHHRHLQELAELPQGFRQHRRGAAEGVAGLGVEDGDVPPVHHPLELADQRHVPGELPLADAADEPQEPFPLQKPVDGHHVVGPMGEHGPGGYGEVHEGVVVAQQQVGGLHALHVHLRQLVFVGDQGARRQQPGHGHQVLPHGGPLHIKALYIVQHGVFRLFSRIFSRKSIAPPPGPCQSERGLLEAS